MKESDMNDQHVQLTRVDRNIGDLVRTFVVERFLTDPQFHIVDLNEYVTKAAPSARLLPTACCVSCGRTDSVTTESSIAPIQSTRLQTCVVDGVGIRSPLSRPLERNRKAISL